jgi:signal transduction histidine kinase
MMGSGYNILAVDDVAMNQSMLEFMLADVTKKFLKAGDGRQAIDILSGNPDVDIILLDLEMPVMDGFETLTFLKQSEQYRDIPVVVITAGKNEILRTLSMGADDFLPKPFNQEELKLRVANHARSKKLHEHHRESRNTLQSVLDAISDPLMLIDEGLNILMSNREAFSAFQGTCSPDAGMACLGEQLNRFYGESMAEAIRRSVREASPLIRRAEVEQEDFRLDEISVFPVLDRCETRRASVLRIRNVTDEVRTERKRSQEEKVQSLELLLTGLLHEINNPTNFILFNIPMLRDYLQQLYSLVGDRDEQPLGLGFQGMSYGEFKEDLGRIVTTIENGAKRIDETLSHLRSVTRERGIGGRSVLKPGEVIEKALCGCGEQLQKTVRTIDVRIDDTLGPIVSNPAALEHILAAVLLNAAQAADKDDSTIRVRAFTGKSWRDRLVIEIEDNGCGMDKKIQGRIFEPFFTTKKYGAGIGMGLYTSRNLVEDLGGTIAVASRPNEGATFRITIPDMKESPEPGC